VALPSPSLGPAGRIGRHTVPSYGEGVLEGKAADSGRVRTAEVIAALSLATDLGIGVPLEHGLHSALFTMRLSERLGVDDETAGDAYYLSLLFYVGCTAGAELAADVFGTDDALTRFATPVRFGGRAELLRGMWRAVAPPEGSALTRAGQLAHGVPRLAREFKDHVAAACEVARLLADRLGLPTSMGPLFTHIDERWDGKGMPGRVSGESIPLSVRIVQVARDAAFQRLLGGNERAVKVVGGRSGGAFDPRIVRLLIDDAGEILALDAGTSAWAHTLACEPAPARTLDGAAIDRALGAIGDFADLTSSYLVGHSAGVSRLAALAAQCAQLGEPDVVAIRRAGLVHDVGRVAIPTRIWNMPGPLEVDEWEQVRLHPYHTERVLSRSPFLAGLSEVSSSHHERLDGSGYHRRTTAAALGRPARLLAAADAYHAMTEPRPHRPPLSPERAADALASEASKGLLDPDAVAAVLDTAGHDVPRIERPAGLTDREAQVVGLLARGLQTKQMAAALGISVKTADRHIQNAYAKLGVSTRAAATLLAIEHGLLAWGELPISRTSRPS
jgi:HD-GYP domain-containing protein (c-di-GMP phosphodiesterase class II)